MATITEITPPLYQTSREARSLCDALMELAGVTAHDVARAELVNGTWFLTVLLRNAAGNRYVEPGTNEVASKVVTVDPLPQHTTPS